MAITFDATNKRIVLDSATTTATELYSRSCDWLLESDNAKYGAVFRQVGGDDLGGGLSIPPYFFLQGGWRVRPMEASHTLIITGNLFVEGGGVPVVPTLGNYNVSVQYTVPVQAQGISTSGSSIDYNAISSAVWTRMIEGFTAEQVTALMASVLLGKVTGAGTGTERFRDLADTTDRVVATVDNSGNRTSITLTP